MVMQTVNVRGASGNSKTLAFVRRTVATIYVCPLARIDEVARGDETYVVGFPAKDVVAMDGESLPAN